MFKALFLAIKNLSENSTNFSEAWGFLKMEGDFYSDLEKDLINIHSKLEDLKLSGSISIRINNENVNINDLKDYIGRDGSWAININKIRFSECETSDCITQFFFYKDTFKDWSSILDPFSPDNPLNENAKVKIVVFGIQESFGGPMLLVTNEEEKLDFDKNIYSLPDDDKIYDIVHIISNINILINPNKHLITFGSVKNPYAIPFLRHSASVLTACLVSEFYSREKIVLRGIKRIQFELIKEYELIDLDHIHSLAEVISWIYEDKTETRIKLFLDRVTLDIDFDETYVNGIIPILRNSFQQAKERYNFVIIERKDQYLKELADLLKDVKSQSELYSVKIRSLLNNLMRDILAGFLLVGFSLFTKISELTELGQSKFLNYVFKILAFYYIGSVVLQLIVNITDIQVSKTEMRYWKNLVREFMPQAEFDNHIKKSLQNRKVSIWIIYPIIILLYLLIATLCFKFPSIWVKISS